MRSLRIVERGNLEMLADPRVFDRLGLVATTQCAALAKCRVRHLVLSVNYANAPSVPECIRTATRDNPLLTEITLKDGMPANWELLWEFRELDLAHVTRITLETGPGRLEIIPRDHHLTIDPDGGDTQHWTWLLAPMRTFETVAILPGTSADEVEVLVRRFALAPKITRVACPG